MIVLIRGGGDLASGVAWRLHRAGLRVVITELSQPLAVRRMASFSQAVLAGQVEIEGVVGKRVDDPEDTLSILQVLSKGQIPVLIDPACRAAQLVHPRVIVDARLLKAAPEPLQHTARLYLGLGPGFVAGENCHVVIETRRGHWLGRVLWQGAAQADTGQPDGVQGWQGERVLRAPQAGVIETFVEIGDVVQPGQPLAAVGGQVVTAQFAGVVRGLLPSGMSATAGLKIGDLDPRGERAMCFTISDKALAVGGGVLEALLTPPELRAQFWA